MSGETLSDRQRRELEFYEKYAQIHGDLEVLFDPVLGLEHRPWNSYWFVYETALHEFGSPREKLLDFGCGNGVASVRFARIGYDVYGFDVTPANIEVAKARATKYGYEDRTHFSVQTAESLDYPNDFFDLVVGIDILHHVEIRPAVLESLRVVKEGRLCVFREHIEAPIFENIRNSALLRRLIPKDPSLSRHITPDERKLTSHDIRAISEICRDIKVRRFELFSRLDYLLRPQGVKKPSLVEKFDAHLLSAFPNLSKFGGAIVLSLRKS